LNRESAVSDENNRLRLPIVLNMQDGRELLGDLIVNIGGTMERTLNNEMKFILFGDADGSERMIAKSNIMEAASGKQASLPAPAAANASDNSSAQQQTAAEPQPAASDPYATLGVATTASAEEITKAYVAKAQAYSPDRIADMGLPAEVVDYCSNMHQHISAAHALLMEGQTQVLTQQRSEATA